MERKQHITEVYLAQKLLREEFLLLWIFVATVGLITCLSARARVCVCLCVCAWVRACNENGVRDRNLAAEALDMQSYYCNILIVFYFVNNLFLKYFRFKYVGYNLKDSHRRHICNFERTNNISRKKKLVSTLMLHRRTKFPLLVFIDSFSYRHQTVNKEQFCKATMLLFYIRLKYRFRRTYILFGVMYYCGIIDRVVISSLQPRKFARPPYCY